MDYKDYISKLIENIPLGIAISDGNGFVNNANVRFLHMFGYDHNEMQGKPMSDLIEGFNPMRKLLLDNKHIINEEIYIHGRKNKLRFSLSAFPIFNEKEELPHIIYVFEDTKKERKLASQITENRAIYTFDKIISQNRDFLKQIEFCKKISDSKSTVLIMGESGTGKEIFAQSIHNHSNRKDKNFIAINSAAIPKNLIESELFGYEEGAFTGARKSGQIGKFELAHKGTIFLDEIGEMPLELQTRLLRVIEEGIVSRVGGTQQTIVDVRIIAASNQDLKEEVSKGRFREDLFYRLNVLPMTILPLRERRDDIPLLMEYFMKQISKRLNKREVPINDEQLNRMIEYDWPGNVRELENLIELIVNLEYMPEDIFTEEVYYKSSEVDVHSGDLSMDYMERNHIIKVLKIYNGNITQTADVLGIARNTLYRRIDKYNIDCANMDQWS